MKETTANKNKNQTWIQGVGNNDKYEGEHADAFTEMITSPTPHSCFHGDRVRLVHD